MVKVTCGCIDLEGFYMIHVHTFYCQLQKKDKNERKINKKKPQQVFVCNLFCFQIPFHLLNKE